MHRLSFVSLVSLVSLVAGLLGSLVLLLAPGCSSSSAPLTLSYPSVSCRTARGGTCYTFWDVTPSQASSATDACTTSLAGSIVPSCPTANRVGCCSYTLQGVSQTLCAYCGTALGYEAQCSGLKSSGAQDPTWTAGSGDAPVSCVGWAPDAG